MRSPLWSYLFLRCLLHYAGVLALFGITALEAIQAAGLSFWLLPALSLAGSLAMCTLIFDLCSRQEIEVIQSYGVPPGAIVKPLAAAIFLPQIVFAGTALFKALGGVGALLVISVALVGGAVAFSLTLSIIWYGREPAAFRACALGCTAQILIFAALLPLLR